MKKFLQFLKTPTATYIMMGILGVGTAGGLLPGEDHLEDYELMVERIVDLEESHKQAMEDYKAQISEQEESLAELREWFDLHVDTSSH